MRIKWTQQNEATQDDNGTLAETPESWNAEMKLLAESGCPDTDQAKMVSHKVVSFDEAEFEADVTEAMAEWLRLDEIAIED